MSDMETPKKVFVARSGDRRDREDRRQQQQPYDGVDRRNGDRRQMFHDRRDTN